MGSPGAGFFFVSGEFPRERERPRDLETSAVHRRTVTFLRVLSGGGTRSVKFQEVVVGVSDRTVVCEEGRLVDTEPRTLEKVPDLGLLHFGELATPTVKLARFGLLRVASFLFRGS